MILTSEQILKELKEIWPEFQWEWPKNPNFTAMPDDMLPRVIEACSIKHMVIIPGIWECENFSGCWQSKVEVFQYDLWQLEEYRPECRWYIGDYLGVWHGVFGGGDHSMNLIRLESGWVLFEPQTDVVSKDLILFTPIVGEA